METRSNKDYYTIKLTEETHAIAQVLRKSLHPMPKNCSWEALFRYFIMLHVHFGFEKPHEIIEYIQRLQASISKPDRSNPVLAAISKVPQKKRSKILQSYSTTNDHNSKKRANAGIKPLPENTSNHGKRRVSKEGRKK